MIQHIEKMQQRDAMRTYNHIVSRCFEDCVKSFRSKNLDDGEQKCLQNCAKKYLKLTQRAGYRFAEQQAQEQQGQK
ncbi:unnamed protein product [Phaeothamnion confervicola]